MNKILFWIGAVTLVIYPQAGLSAPSPQEVMARVQAQYDRTGAFKARFRQESRLKAVNQADVAEGWMYFQKPCRMRWQYENPPEQKKEIISDGRQVWMYMPQDSLVMVYQLNQVLRSDLVMRFFSGMGQFRRDFNIAFSRPPQARAPFVIDLFPLKEQPELTRLTLTINPATYLVDRLEFTNALGEETRFVFSQSQLDVRLKPDFFTFVPPPGIQVVKESPG
ncbi:MAG: outer membrane lipoprotein carrier protein LolA [Desulfobaccales bacterium]|nr:outer membrane lipoprotein carrier protein LolA [Desulfobaccales bacterium]